MKKFFSALSDAYSRRAPAIRFFTFLILEVFLLVLGSYGLAIIALLLLPLCFPSAQEMEAMDPFNAILGPPDKVVTPQSIKLYFLQGDNRDVDGFTNFWMVRNEQAENSNICFMAYMDTESREGKDYLQKAKFQVAWSTRQISLEGTGFCLCFFMCPVKTLELVETKLIELRKILADSGYDNYKTVCQKLDGTAPAGETAAPKA